MKTTIEIRDELMDRAKRLAKRTGQPVRALVEEGLRRVLEASEALEQGYQLPDLSTGDPAAKDPLEALSWHEQRDLIYERHAIHDRD